MGGVCAIGINLQVWTCADLPPGGAIQACGAVDPMRAVRSSYMGRLSS